MNDSFKINDKFMRRALQLAKNGEGRVSPNPMVGAVIEHNGRIIGEGFHAFYGGGHAEVKAVNSVKPEDRDLLKESTLYVTLEPCSHYGKTPPCAELIVKEKIPNVVVGTLDPNPKVAGKGIEILKDAGVNVALNVLQEECIEINRRFMKAHTDSIPWVMLKWAQSADGFMAAYNPEGNLVPIKFSTPVSSVWMHRCRAQVDAILVGANTEKIDHPQLNVRHWGGNSPKKFVATGYIDLDEFLTGLRKDGVTSLMVEGGAKLLKSFLDQNLYDEIRVEISPTRLDKGLKAPAIPSGAELIDKQSVADNIILRYRNPLGFHIPTT